MKSKVLQFRINSFIKVIPGFTLLTTLALSPIVSCGLFAARAAVQQPEQAVSESDMETDRPVQVAQAIETIVLYETRNHTVRVFRRGDSRPFMNVYDKNRQLLRVDEQPAQLRQVNGLDAYVSFGVFDSRQVQYASQISRNPAEPEIPIISLSILGIENVGREDESDVILTEFAEDIAFESIPSSVGLGQEDSVLFFETESYAVRVFTRDDQRLMNVYDRLSRFDEVSGKVANFVTPSAPFEEFSSYVSSGTRNDQPAQYYARFNPSTDVAVLEIYDIDGRRIFREPALSSTLEANIPMFELSAGAQGGTVASIDDAYVAAVFGNEDTLRAVRRLYPDAYFDESARPGRFINAGAFSNENDATIRVLQLRSEGFNARLVYRDVQYR